MGQRQRCVHAKRPERRVTAPALAEPQVAADEQRQRRQAAKQRDDHIEAAAKIAQTHRAAHNAEESNEAAQLKRGACTEGLQRRVDMVS